MSLRQRERITRHPDKKQCDACRFEQFEHDVKRVKVAGQWVFLCSTCRMQHRSGELADRLATIEETQGADVNHELLQDLRGDA